MQLLIQKFCQENKNWEEILEKEPYYIKIKKDNGYVLFMYTLGLTDFSIPLCRECRGIILDELNNFKPMCVPFYKFFNFGEPHADEIDWDSAEVQEKVDGSLCKIWYGRDGELVFSTNGTIYADKAECINIYEDNVTFGDLIRQAMPSSVPIPINATHMFELTSKYNKILVEYEGEPRLTYLGSRKLDTFKEYQYPCLKKSFKVPKLYDLKNLEEVKQVCAQITDLSEEGFVVVDKNYNRIKVKSPHYIKAAHCITKFSSFKGIIKLLKNEEIDEILSYCPKEEKEKVEEVKNNLMKISKIISIVFYHYNNIKDQKEFAIAIKDYPYNTLLFKKRKNNALKFYDELLELNDKKIKELYDHFLEEGSI